MRKVSQMTRELLREEAMFVRQTTHLIEEAVKECELYARSHAQLKGIRDQFRQRKRIIQTRILERSKVK